MYRSEVLLLLLAIAGGAALGAAAYLTSEKHPHPGIQEDAGGLKGKVLTITEDVRERAAGLLEKLGVYSGDSGVTGAPLPSKIFENESERAFAPPGYYTSGEEWEELMKQHGFSDKEIETLSVAAPSLGRYPKPDEVVRYRGFLLVAHRYPPGGLWYTQRQGEALRTVYKAMQGEVPLNVTDGTKITGVYAESPEEYFQLSIKEMKKAVDFLLEAMETPQCEALRPEFEKIKEKGPIVVVQDLAPSVGGPDYGGSAGRGVVHINFLSGGFRFSTLNVADDAVGLLHEITHLSDDDLYHRAKETGIVGYEVYEVKERHPENLTAVFGKKIGITIFASKESVEEMKARLGARESRTGHYFIMDPAYGVCREQILKTGSEFIPGYPPLDRRPIPAYSEFLNPDGTFNVSKLNEKTGLFFTNGGGGVRFLTEEDLKNKYPEVYKLYEPPSESEPGAPGRYAVFVFGDGK